MKAQCFRGPMDGFIHEFEMRSDMKGIILPIEDSTRLAVYDYYQETESFIFNRTCAPEELVSTDAPKHKNKKKS